MDGLNTLSIGDLLRLHDSLLEELRDRGVVRSSNNPVADYTEWLCAQKLGLFLVGKSSAGFDAHDTSGNRVQIKGRRVTRHNKSVQLSQLRKLADNPFDLLLGVVFNSDFTVAYAGLVPLSMVIENSTYRSHTNAHVFHMKRELLTDPRARDVTDALIG
jgi:hypothetical protein